MPDRRVVIDKFQPCACIRCGAKPVYRLNPKKRTAEIFCPNPKCHGGISIRDFSVDNEISLIELWNILNRPNRGCEMIKEYVRDGVTPGRGGKAAA